MANLPYIASYEHSPGEKLDYEIQYHRQLKAGENIVSSAWSVSPSEGAPEVVEGTLFDEKDAVIWIKGGTVGATFILTNKVVTNSSPPRIYERSIRILIRQS